MRKLSLILFLSVILFSCSKNRDKQAEDQLYSEVMAIHDEVMPKMDQIMQLKEELKSQIDSSLIASEEKDTITGIIAALDESDEAMMQWMRQFNKDQKGKHEERMEYLTQEKEKIGQVRVKMLTSINKAEQYLKTK